VVDEYAFVDLFRSEYARLCRVAFVLLSDRELAEDAVMEAFLRVYNAERTGASIESRAGYLTRAVTNIVKNLSRRRQLERRVNSLFFPWRPTAAGDDIADVVVERDILSALRGLPAGQRTVLVLRYIGDFSEAEIADRMQCSVGTVKSQLHKARNHFRHALERSGTTGSVGEND